LDVDISPITLDTVNIEAADPNLLAAFWAAITGGIPVPIGDSVYLPPAGPEGFGMFFQPLTMARPARSAIHLARRRIGANTRQRDVWLEPRLIGRGLRHADPTFRDEGTRKA
jgi:hypothetical protein